MGGSFICPRHNITWEMWRTSGLNDWTGEDKGKKKSRRQIAEGPTEYKLKGTPIPPPPSFDINF